MEKMPNWNVKNKYVRKLLQSPTPFPTKYAYRDFIISEIFLLIFWSSFIVILKNGLKYRKFHYKANTRDKICLFLKNIRDIDGVTYEVTWYLAQIAFRLFGFQRKSGTSTNICIQIYRHYIYANKFKMTVATTWLTYWMKYWMDGCAFKICSNLPRWNV